VKPKLSAKAEELLARLEAREGKRTPAKKPEAVEARIKLDPSWPFPPAPVGALATENPLNFVVVGCRKR